MAGACIGFLFHNRYKASILMGDVGSFALGGALTAMAACTGMFIPLFISSGVFVLEVFSVIVQVYPCSSHISLIQIFLVSSNFACQLSHFEEVIRYIGFSR